MPEDCASDEAVPDAAMLPPAAPEAAIVAPPASKECIQCQATNAVVWRLDRETKDILCNPCYLKKYPRPPKTQCSEGKVESAPKKRRKKLELKASGDPIADLEKEALEFLSKAQEVKREEVKVKEEVKEEEEEFDVGLNDLFESAMVKEKKTKRHTHSAINQDNGAVPDDSVESENEDEKYGVADPGMAPKSIIVEASGHPKCDGRYDKLPKSCRGRFCYYQRKKDKIMFFYWTEMWRIGSSLGDTRCFAKIKSVEGLQDCCEPYPHTWQVFDKEESVYKPVVALRVFDTSVASEQPQLPQPFLEAPSVAKASGGGGAEVKQEIKEEDGGIKQEIKKEDDAKDKKEAPSSDTDSSKSSSVSSSSDSSDDDDKKEDETKPEETEADKAAKEEAKAAKDLAAKETKATAFQEKLRSEVQKAPEGEARIQKIVQIKKMLSARAAQLESAAGMTPEKTKALVTSLESQFGQPKKAPIAPKGPPPKHLLPGANQVCEDNNGTAMPSTPPEAVNHNEPCHRKIAPARGVLKRRGKNDATNHIRMSTRMEAPPTEIITVQSWRSAGEVLWWQAPGSIVMCDECNRGVSQSMGALQGAPGMSQFTQDQFLCSDCMQG